MIFNGKIALLICQEVMIVLLTFKVMDLQVTICIILTILSDANLSRQ